MVKGISQIDFVVAAGVFIIVVIFVLNFTTNFITPQKEIIDISTLRSRANSLLDMASDEKSELSLETTAYRFNIKLESTIRMLINESFYPQYYPVNLESEFVRFRFGLLNFSKADFNSTSIYLNGTRLQSKVQGDLVTTATSIKINEIKLLEVYFDDDSNFTSQSVSIVGSNFFNEITYPVETIRLIQNRKLHNIMSMDYSNMRKTVGGEFRIELEDKETHEVISIGAEPRSRGDVVVLSKNVLFQDETAGIKKGEMRVYTW
jgi:hypothetical protein